MAVGRLADRDAQVLLELLHGVLRSFAEVHFGQRNRDDYRGEQAHGR
jgi:hypothetical protein